MKWERLLKIVGNEPVFTSSLLMVGNITPADNRRQISRWVRSGRIIRLRKGVYLLASPYRKISPHAFLLANTLKSASYVSLQSALAYHGMIPEYTPVTTSVTTGRPENIDTAAGTFYFSHIKKSWFSGYQRVEVTPGQAAFLAGPEKCLLDLIYLTPGGGDLDYLRGLRLQNLGRLNLPELSRIAASSERPKLIRAAEHIKRLFIEEEKEYQKL